MKWFNSDFIKETDIKNEFRINIKKMVPMLDDKWCFWDRELEKFVILFEDEAVTEDLKKKFQVFFKKNNWSEGDVIVYHSNSDLNEKSFRSFDNFFMECKSILNNNYFSETDYESEKIKKYNCLNHSMKIHRQFIYKGLKGRNLLDFGYVSFLEKGITLPDYLEQKTDFKQWRWDTLNYQISSSTYFNIVTETHHNIDMELNSTFITEKICKALITQPFILVGNVNHIKYIKDKGFETYSEIFDESYDTIESPDKRLNFVLDEVERVCKMEENKLKDLYESVIWKVKHNIKVMSEFKDDLDAKKYINIRGYWGGIV